MAGLMIHTDGRGCGVTHVNAAGVQTELVSSLSRAEASEQLALLSKVYVLAFSDAGDRAASFMAEKARERREGARL